MEGQGVLEVTENEAERSLKVLQRLVATNKSILRVPTFDSLVPLTEDSLEADHRWDNCRVVSVAQFHCQVNY